MKTAPKPWKPEHVARLRALAKTGITSREAAKTMRRPHAGLRFKAMREGISFFGVKQPPGVQKRLAARARRSR